MHRLTTTRSGHRCAAPGCPVRVGTTLLMCRDHWGRLPRSLQTAVTTAWTKLRMDDWRAACRRAVAWIAANPAPAARAPLWCGIDLSHPEARDRTIVTIHPEAHDQ